MVASKILLTPMDGTPEQIVLADFDIATGDFNPTAANDLRVSSDGSNELEVEIVLADLADGAARQSAKWDFGANFAQRYRIRAAFELADTPIAGAIIEVYFGFSPVTTAGVANPANLTGADAAYAGYDANLAASVLQLDGPYVFICTANATATVQVAELSGILKPTGRYGMCVVKNESGAALFTDDVECHIVLDPIVAEGQ